MRIIAFPFAALCLLLFSCQTNKKEGKKGLTPRSYELSIQDSIQIDYLGTIRLMDVHPGLERILLYDQQQGKLLLTDLEGNHLKEMEKRGDFRDSFGTYPWVPARFKDNGNFVLTSHRGYLEFDQEGELVNLQAYQTTDVPFFAGNAGASNEWIEHDGIVIQLGVVPWGEYDKTQPQYYDQFLLLARIDPTEGSIERIIHLEDGSFFKNGMVYEISELFPSIAKVGEKLAVIVGTDPHLMYYDINPPHQLLERKALDYVDYYPSQGKSPTDADPKAITFDGTAGRTLTLKKYKNHLLSTYSQGYDREDRESYHNLEGNEAYQSFFQKIKGKYTDRMQVMDLDGNTLGNLKIPAKLTSGEFLVRDEQLWFLSSTNEDEEEDFVKIYQVELVEK